jgi:hypothetical protein
MRRITNCRNWTAFAHSCMSTSLPIEVGHRVARAPLRRRLRVEPVHPLGAGDDLSERIEARLGVVGARVAEDEHRGAVPDRVEVAVDEVDQSQFRSRCCGASASSARCR